MKRTFEIRSDGNYMERNQAFQIVAYVAGKNDYDKANKMLGVVERTIKEDKNNLITTDVVRFINESEKRLFKEEL